MPATGLEIFDKTLQTTNIWLDEIMEEIGQDRQAAWHVLGAVLRTLRDRLTVDESAHLSAQLPLLIRGLYYDQWQPSHVPTKCRTKEEFLEHVAEGLRDIRPVDQQAPCRRSSTFLPITSARANSTRSRRSWYDRRAASTRAFSSRIFSKDPKSNTVSVMWARVSKTLNGPTIVARPGRAARPVNPNASRLSFCRVSG